MATNVVRTRAYELATVVAVPRGRPAGPAVGIGITWRALREARRWTVAQAAKETGVSKALINFIENGERPNPGKKVIEKTAKAYGVSSFILLFDPGADLPDHLKTFLSSLRRRGEKPGVLQLASLAMLESGLRHEPKPHEYEIWWGLITAPQLPMSEAGASLPPASSSSTKDDAGAPPGSGGGRGR